MIITDRFVFLHLHKSGGTFVNETLLRFVPGARQVGYHLPRSMIPAQSASLPVLGLVRNPWSYYVSWFSFQRQQPRPNALYRVLSIDGQLDFKACISNMLELGSRPELLAQLVTALPADYVNRGLNLPGHAVAGIRGSGVGFYSWLYKYFYDGGSAALHLGRMENLRWDLMTMLTGVGQPFSEAMRIHILEQPARNVSQHQPYVEYYDTELQNAVAKYDAAVIDRHKYWFGEGQA